MSRNWLLKLAGIFALICVGVLVVGFPFVVWFGREAAGMMLRIASVPFTIAGLAYLADGVVRLVRWDGGS